MISSLRTIKELQDCVEECREWHEKVLQSLNDAQVVEYHRLFSFLLATKQYYRRVFDASFEERKRRKREVSYFWVIGIAAFGLYAYFYDSSSMEGKMLVGFFLLAVLILTTDDKVFERETRFEMQAIERDLLSANISLSALENIVRKEKQIEQIIDSLEDTESHLKDRSRLEGEIIQFYLRNRVIELVTNLNSNHRLPIAVYSVID